MKIKKIGIVLVIIAGAVLWFKGYIDPAVIGKRFFNAQVSKYTKYGSRDVADKFNTVVRNVKSITTKDTNKLHEKYHDDTRYYLEKRHENRAVKIIQSYNGADREWFKGPNAKPRLFQDLTVAQHLSRDKDYLSNPSMTIHFDMPFSVKDDNFKQVLSCVTDEHVDYDNIADALEKQGFDKDRKKSVDIKLKKCTVSFQHVVDAVTVYITF